MDLQLKDKRCIVLGASRGIGRAIADGLAKEGANLAICGRDAASLQKAATELRAQGVQVHAATCDLADPAALAEFLDHSRVALGGVDVLVHNASALAVGPDLAAWEASLKVDLMAGTVILNVIVDRSGGNKKMRNKHHRNDRTLNPET